ncbi:MAG: MOSC domain-containing protein [Acidobacteriaceae bacterium]|nr:MOSC domain-containing protein [Acidobacteriaceae bacterium]
MTGSVVQINISRGGLPKYAISRGVLTPLGIEGDSHNHPRFHGGPMRALLLIAFEVIEELKVRGYALYPGALCENLTMRGIDHRQMRSGQRYRIGECVVELTKVRVPCNALDIYGPSIKQEIFDDKVKVGDPTSPRWAMSGFYTSVVHGGAIQTNDIIALIDHVV